MNDHIKKVGDGWGEEADYATLIAWWVAESGIDYAGQPIIAICKGNIGSNQSLGGSSVNGAKVYTDNIKFNGSNQNELAVLRRLTLAADIEITDIYIDSNNAFVGAINLNSGSDGTIIENCFITHPNPNSVDIISVNVTSPNTNINRNVIACNGALHGVDCGFSFAINITNNTAFGASVSNIDGSGSGQIIENNFCFATTGLCYRNIAGATFNNNASQDNSGNLTGFTSSELIDLANEDYRLKASSELAIAGIGAFVEEIAQVIDRRFGSLSASSESSIDTSGSKSSFGTVNTASDSVISTVGKKTATSSLSAASTTSISINAFKASYGSFNIESQTSSFQAGTKSTTSTLNVVSISSIKLERTEIDRRFGAFSVTAASSINLNANKKASSSLIATVGCSINTAGKKKALGRVSLTSNSLINTAASKSSFGEFTAASQTRVRLRAINSDAPTHINHITLLGTINSTTIQGRLKKPLIFRGAL
jgi:hypothetical protein